MMKGIKVIGLGIAVWGLSLLWPEINLILLPRVMVGLGLALGIATLIWEVLHHLKHWQHHPNKKPKNNHPSGPVPPIVLARR